MSPRMSAVSRPVSEAATPSGRDDRLSPRRSRGDDAKAAAASGSISHRQPNRTRASHPAERSAALAGLDVLPPHLADLGVASPRSSPSRPRAGGSVSPLASLVRSWLVVMRPPRGGVPTTVTRSPFHGINPVGTARTPDDAPSIVRHHRDD